jgi:hypothetical protein
MANRAARTVRPPADELGDDDYRHDGTAPEPGDRETADENASGDPDLDLDDWPPGPGEVDGTDAAGPEDALGVP